MGPAKAPQPAKQEQAAEDWSEPQTVWQRVRYTMENKILKKQHLS